MSLPNTELLTQIQQYILKRPNKPEESKKSVHYGLFLLCSQAGLRVSEAINFNLNSKTNQGLYKISPTKKRTERYVYIPAKVISELKKNNWQPNQTNRWNFYCFLKRIKRDMLMKQLNISPQVELTPHSLRRAFATHWAENNLPLPLLSKLLGHASVRTTALYWLNVYSEPEQSIKPPSDDIADILLGKEWIEKHEKDKPKQPLIISQPEPVLITEPSPSQLANTSLPISTEPEENFSLNVSEIEPQKVQPLVNEAKVETPIEPKTQQPTQILTKPTKIEVSEPTKAISSKPNQEQVLLNRIKQLETDLSVVKTFSKDLQEELKKVQAENKQLKQELEKSKAVAKAEWERADYYEKQLKIIARGIYQWHKINYYQQQESEQKSQIVQVERPPPWNN